MLVMDLSQIIINYIEFLKGPLCDMTVFGSCGASIQCHSIVLQALAPDISELVVGVSEPILMLPDASIGAIVCVMNLLYTGW